MTPVPADPGDLHRPDQDGSASAPAADRDTGSGHLLGRESRADTAADLAAAVAEVFAGTEAAAETEESATDTAKLLRRFALRAFALAFVAGITGLTTVALVLGLVGSGLALAPVRGVRRGGGPAAPAPPGW